MPAAESPILTVSALTATIRQVLESQVGAVQVQGEISNFRRQPSGHLYFTLKDEGAQLSAVMFRGDTRGLTFEPRDGDQAIARGQITVYPPRGNYQIRVTSLRPHGRGSLQERFEALKRRLHAEGLFDADRKRPLPTFPRRIAVITSPSGAALQDFLNVLGRRCPRIAVTVFGVRVQGTGAHLEAIHALQAAAADGRFDAIVITRGGGSLEDLWEFNEEALARAIAACPIPVISGVGHEIDFTICDFVADLRAPTPSAAAELLSRADEQWRADLNSLHQRLLKAAHDQLAQARRRLELCRTHYVFRDPVRIVHQWFQRLDDLSQRLRHDLLSQFHQRTRHLASLRQTFQALNPRRRFLQRLDELSHRLRYLLTAQLDRRTQRFSACQKTWQALDPRRRLSESRRRLQALEAQLRLLSPDSTLARGYTMTLTEEGRLLRSALEAAQAPSFTVRYHDGTVPVRPQS